MSISLRLEDRADAALLVEVLLNAGQCSSPIRAKSLADRLGDALDALPPIEVTPEERLAAWEALPVQHRGPRPDVPQPTNPNVRRLAALEEAAARLRRDLATATP